MRLRGQLPKHSKTKTLHLLTKQETRGATLRNAKIPRKLLTLGRVRWLKFPNVGEKIRWIKETHLGCEHVIKENSRLGTADHPFAHVFDKNIPDPAAKTVAAAPVQNFAEYIDEEGVYIRHHCQPRKALSAISSVEADATQLGDLRCTEATAVNGSEMPLSWDNASKQTKLKSNVSKHQAVAAVRRIRDKNAAKKQVRQQAFYDVNNLSSNQGCMKNPVNEVVYDMKSFLQHAVDRYKELVGPKFHNLKKVATPFHDDKIARPVETEAEVKGELAPIASRVLMKLLFAARMARYDLLRAVQGLASRVTNSLGFRV